MDFDGFVVVHGQSLVRFAYLMTGDFAAAEDLVQNALLKSFRKWDRIEQPIAYVRRAVLNGFLDSKRRGLREVLLASDSMYDFDAPVESAPSTGVDVSDPLIADVLGLPRRERAVLVLRYFDDMGDQQIADLLGIATPTVRATASRALAKLRHLHTTGDTNP